MHLTNSDFQALIQKVHRDTGLDLTQYKPTFVQRRLASRLRAKGVSSYRAYMRLLDEDEYRSLLDTLTINLTSFFRDTSTFLALRDEVLRPLLRKREKTGTRRLDIWSAGCASGEEPYSVAIMIHQLLGRQLHGWRIRILGTDIDRRKLQQARLAVYNSFSFRGTDWPHLDRYFTKTSTGKQLNPHIKQLVQFRQHDLIADRPPGRFDIILCRNVLIYLKRGQQTQILNKFYQALSGEGVLVLGKTEILPTEVSSLFQPINTREHIHRKRLERHEFHSPSKKE